MKKEVSDFVERPVLDKRTIVVLRFAPRAIVCGLQCQGYKQEEQFSILRAICRRYGESLSDNQREYLERQIAALREICAA